MGFVYKIIFLTFIVFCFKDNNKSHAAISEQIFKKSVVFFSFIDSKNYQKKLKRVHEQLTTNRLDVVNYLDSINFKVNKSVNESLLDYLNDREVENVIYYQEKDNMFVFRKLQNIQSKNPPYLKLNSDSLSFYVNKTIKNNPKTLTSFLFPSEPEIIKKAKIRLSNQILIKPNLKKEKVGYTNKTFINTQPNLIQIKEVEDYRFYYSEGINYIVYTIKGTNDFLKQTFNIKSLPSNQKRNVIMVVEHTVTKNKYFFHEEGVTDEVKLISLLFD